MGCQPDAGRLRAAIHRQKCAQMVSRPGRQHSAGRNLVPRPGSDRRHHHHELRVQQRGGGDPSRRRADLRRRRADQLLCRAGRRGHRPADPRCWIRLYRLDRHIVDLCLVHLHFFRHRGRDPGDDIAGLLRDSAACRVPDLRRRHHSPGNLRHHPDQPDPALVAANMAGVAGFAVRRGGRVSNGCVQPLDAFRRHRTRHQRIVRAIAVRGGGVCRVLADRPNR